MSDSDTPTDGSRHHYEHGAFLLETRVEQVEREQTAARERDTTYKEEQYKLNQEQRKFNRRTFWTNVLLVLLTGGLVATSIVSDRIAIWQSRTAEANSDATRAAAAAALSAANTATKALYESKNQYDYTLGQMQQQTAAQAESAKTAKSAVAQARSAAADAKESAERSLTTQIRPWLHMDITDVKPIMRPPQARYILRHLK